MNDSQERATNTALFMFIQLKYCQPNVFQFLIIFIVLSFTLLSKQTTSVCVNNNTLTTQQHVQPSISRVANEQCKEQQEHASCRERNLIAYITAYSLVQCSSGSGCCVWSVKSISVVTAASGYSFLKCLPPRPFHSNKEATKAMMFCS